MKNKKENKFDDGGNFHPVKYEGYHPEFGISAWDYYAVHGPYTPIFFF